MKLDNLDLMSRDEMLEIASSNRVEHQYTTEDLWENEDHNYVVCNRNGYLNYANGEEVIDENDLPEDGWFDCTEYDEDSDVDSYSDSGFYDNPLYDSDDDW